MTLDDYLTFTLPERIAWLHSADGPKGKLSHDRFAAILGTSRQVVITWEKPGGPEPNAKFRAALAEFSGFPSSAFSRRQAEAPAAATIRSRLEELAELVGRGFLSLGVTQDQLRPRGGNQNQREGTP